MEAADREITESENSPLLTLVIDIPGDLPCMQQASYLEVVPLMWMLPLYVNQKSGDDDDWPGDLDFDPNWPSFDPALDFIEANILSKFH